MPFAVRNLLRRPLRTGLTLAGITVGAATYLVLASASAGIVEETETILRSLRIDLIVQRADIPVPWHSRIPPEEVEILRRLPGVADVFPVVVGVTKIETRPRFFIFGLDAKSLETVGLKIASGRVYVPAKGELLAGADAARELDLKQGDRVAIVGRREFTVVGVYETGRRVFDGGVILDIPDAQQAFRLGDLVNIVLIELAPGARAEDIVSAVASGVPELEATPANLFARQKAWFGNLRKFGRALAILALAIAALGISNTLSMNVAERTGELGLLRALGWRRARIARLILAEGLLLAGGGAALGFPAAAAILWFFAGQDFLGLMPGQVPLPTALKGLGTVLFAGFVASLPPLVHALRIRPAQALRQL